VKGTYDTADGGALIWGLYINMGFYIFCDLRVFLHQIMTHVFFFPPLVYTVTI